MPLLDVPLLAAASHAGATLQARMERVGAVPLRSLALASNGIGVVGATALGRALARNTLLRTLRMGGNPAMGDGGAGALAAALGGSNRSLEALTLEGAGIGALGAQRLLRALDAQALGRSSGCRPVGGGLFVVVAAPVGLTFLGFRGNLAHGTAVAGASKEALREMEAVRAQLARVGAGGAGQDGGGGEAGAVHVEVEDAAPGGGGGGQRLGSVREAQRPLAAQRLVAARREAVEAALAQGSGGPGRDAFEASSYRAKLCRARPRPEVETTFVTADGAARAVLPPSAATRTQIRKKIRDKRHLNFGRR